MGVIKATVATLKNLIPSKLTDDDPLQEDLWNKAVDALSNCATALEEVDKRITPIGMIYIQLPGRSLPTSMWPGTSWSDISGSFAGGFFRAKGGYADNTGTRQGDAIRNIIGKFATGNQDPSNGGAIVANGAFSVSWGNSFNINPRQLMNTGGNVSYEVAFNASSVVPTAPENRPVNYAVTIWQCTAV